jgi:MYXO-CTERM domain-containing protein
MRLGSVGVFAAVALLPLTAWAGNGLHPRTEVLWPDDVACSNVVDKSVDPVYEVSYEIPFEDTEVTEDEVDDSRRHQFFGICRQFHSQIFLPNWITYADVDAAIGKNLIDENSVTDEQVIETNQDWDDCWFRVNEDADRRPITNEMAAVPVPWDTTDVPVGVYVIWGYTYEPAFNVWTQRQGTIVKVIDGGAPEDIGPGAAISTREQTPYKGDTIQIEGCVNTLSGSTMSGFYASTAGASDPDWEPGWVPFMEDEAVMGESFSVDFIAPEEVAGQTIMMRIDVTDPMGRTYEAHMRENVIVLKGMSEDCETGGDFIGGAGCGDTEGDTGETSSATTETATATDGDGDSGTSAASEDMTTGPDQDDGGNDKGCGCRASNDGAPWGWAFMLLPLFARRRSR